MQNKKTCIILDYNIWINNHLLRTPIASALLHGIVLNKAKIALPEVIKKEIFIHTERRGRNILNNIITELMHIWSEVKQLSGELNNIVGKDPDVKSQLKKSQGIEKLIAKFIINICSFNVMRRKIRA